MSKICFADKFKDRTKDTIVLVGDSLARGIGEKLEQQSHMVSTKSRGGARIEHVTEQIGLLQDNVDRHLVVLVGTNNVQNEGSEAIRLKYKSLLEASKKVKNRKVSVIGIPRRFDLSGYQNSRRIGANLELERMCGELDIGFVAYEPNRSRIAKDELHFNHVGQDELARKIFEHCKSFFSIDLSTPDRRSARAGRDSIGQNLVPCAVRIKQKENKNKSDQLLIKNRFAILANLEENNNNGGVENNRELSNRERKVTRATKANSGRGSRGNKSKVDKQKLGNNNANNKLINKRKDSLTCFYFNARSIMNKIDELELYLTQEKPDIVGITETWTYEDVQDSEICMEGYTLLRKDRVIGDKIRGGGVALYIKNEFSVTTRDDLTEANFPESIWCNIEIGGKRH